MDDSGCLIVLIGCVCVIDPVPSYPTQPADKLSALQELFFRAKFGPDAIKIRSQPDGDAERKQADAMRQDFKTDGAILRYLLTEIMDPAKKICTYDTLCDARLGDGGRVGVRLASTDH